MIKKLIVDTSVYDKLDDVFTVKSTLKIVHKVNEIVDWINRQEAIKHEFNRKKFEK